jgi:DNA-binding transcriptional MerR regulator
MMAYTVKQISELAGVSVRALHYYDEIGLLEPSWVGENGYRYYEDEALFRLQQILFFRELDLSLDEIKTILDEPEFDLVAALHAHRAGIEAKIHRLSGLINTIDSTILHLTGEVEMSKPTLFQGFSEEEEKRYAQEARETWGAKEVDASYKRWNRYTPEKQAAIKAEGGVIYQDLAALTDQDPASPAVQQVIGRWHQHMRYFYEPSVERLRGLGQLYVEHPDFARNFRELHPNLPEFMRSAIEHYCDNIGKTG